MASLVRDEAAAWLGEERIAALLSGELKIKQAARLYSAETGLEFETARNRTRDVVEFRRIARSIAPDSEAESVELPPGLTETEALRRRLALIERERNLLAGRLADEDRLISQLRDHLAVAKPPKPYKPVTIRAMTKEQEVAHLLSDCQIGERVEAAETGGIGGDEGYDIDIFAKRLEIWAEKSVSILTQHRKITPIANGQLWYLGDGLENQTIFKGQGARICDNIAGQFTRGADLLTGAIRYLAGYYECLNIKYLLGNHGRIGDKGENLHYVSWEYLLAQFIKEKLSACTNIVWDVPKSWWSIADVMGWKFYLTHGDDVLRYMGLPYYSIDKYDAKMTLLLQQQGISFDYLVMGHHHQCVQWDRPWGEKLINGSFVSGNAFAAKKLQANCRPTQLMFGIGAEHGVTWRYPIRLDGGKEMDSNTSTC